MRQLIAALALVLVAAQAGASETRMIAVNGIGERSIDPNMVTFSVEVWSKANTAKKAQQLAASSFTGLKKALDSYKIKKEDIQTDNYSLSPEYEYDQKSRQNKMVGFRVSQSLTVVLRKVDDAGAFLDALTAGTKEESTGVSVSSLSWDSDKRSEIERQTLADAVKSARLKADEIAKAAGVKIKNIARISHNTPGSNNPPVFRSYSNKMVAMDAASTEIASGQIKVRVEVNAEYEIQ